MCYHSVMSQWLVEFIASRFGESLSKGCPETAAETVSR